MTRRARSRPGRIVLAILPVWLPATLLAQAPVEGILEPLATVCEQATHRVVDTCTGETRLALSSWADLAPFACRHVAGSGSEAGLFCPAVDLRDIAGSAPACPVEVRNVTVSLVDTQMLLTWDAVPCAQAYDIIYGVLGIPAIGACRGEEDCGLNQFCLKFPGDCAGVGQCRTKPTACVAFYDPVCGCDGVSYGNSCEANYRDMTVACKGLCPCPAECSDPSRPCLEEGPVACWTNDFPESRRPGGQIISGVTPPAGQAFFLLIRASGPGDIGTTTYGFTEPDRQERFFAGDCPR